MSSPDRIWFSEIRHLLTREENYLLRALRYATLTEEGVRRSRAFVRLTSFESDMVEKYALRVDPSRVFNGPPAPL